MDVRSLMAACLLAVVVLATPGLAQGGDRVDLTIETRDKGCPASSMCLVVTDGSLVEISSGDRLYVTVVNTGSTVHNVHVTATDQAGPGHRNTDGDTALANTANLRPGDRDDLVLTAPGPGAGVYFWCDVGAHETLGMWLNSTLGGGPEELGDETANAGPGPGVATALIGVAIGALALTSRSNRRRPRRPGR